MRMEQRCIQWDYRSFSSLQEMLELVGQMVLVNLDILDEYLETFRIVDSDYYG